MELESQLLACNFDEADAKLIVGGFLTGVSILMEAKGATETQTVREILSEEQLRKVLFLVVDDRLAQLPSHRLALIDLSLLEALGY
jgi:hypothetical protein